MLELLNIYYAAISVQGNLMQSCVQNITTVRYLLDSYEPTQ